MLVGLRFRVRMRADGARQMREVCRHDSARAQYYPCAAERTPQLPRVGESPQLVARIDVDCDTSFPPRAVSTALSALLLALLPGYASPSPDQPNSDSKAVKSASQKPMTDWDRYRATANRHATIGEALAHKALSYRGVRYVFGGTS